VKPVDVLGYDGAIGNPDGEDQSLLVTWDEGGTGPCHKQYWVQSKGVRESELLRIANSLKAEGAS
jgi:hypothetical protein